MRRRSRSRKKSMPISTIILATIVIIGALVWIVPKLGLSDASSCGDREIDEEKEGYCLVTSSDFDELVLVVGNTQNSPAPILDFINNSDLKRLLSGVFYSAERGSNPSISIVSASGNNEGIPLSSNRRPKKNISASNNELTHLAKEINKAITTPAVSGGANYLGGILKANSLISSNAKNPLILVFGSGYSDGGVLDFANNDLFGKYQLGKTSAIESIVNQNHALREGMLSGKTVYWYNIGDVALPQKNLNGFKEDLKDIYKTAFGYLGVKQLIIDKNINIAGNASSVETPYSVQQVYASELSIGDYISVNERIGEFYGDEARLKNEAAVKNHVSMFVNAFLKNTSGKKLKLTGYIAYCAPGSVLGKMRADTMKNILVSMGVPANKIDTYGQPGTPPVNKNVEFSCDDSPLPLEERRTVIIEVVAE